jgi:large conductance mechanosensitive channel
MGIIREFKEFAVRGNVVDMAVGIIIGAAFGRIVSSLVADVMMPPLGLALGGADFSEQRLLLRDAQAATEIAPEVAEVSINYGLFVNATINFIIVAFAVFLVVKGVNALKRKQVAQAEAQPPSPTLDQELLAEIRDLLRAPAR